MHLINRLVPVELESLESLLERLRQANYYEEAIWFQEFLPGPQKQRLDLLRSETHYQALADLTGLSGEMLQKLTLQRFVPHFYQPEDLSHLPVEYGDLDIPIWEPHGLGRYVHGRRYWKLCPLCWREQHAALLPWSLRHVTSCPTHAVLLVDHCSECGEQLHMDLVNGRCARCEKDVGTISTISIRGHLESITLTSLVWTAILCDPACIPPKSSPFDPLHPLRQMTAPNLLMFLWRFAHLLAMRDPHNPLFDLARLLPGKTWAAPPADLWRADVATVHNVLVAIARLLLCWPSAWYAILARLIEVEASGAFGTAHFPRILAQQFAGPTWTWLHRSWVEFMWLRIEQKADIHPWIRYFYQAEKYFQADFSELEPKYPIFQGISSESNSIQDSTWNMRSPLLTQRVAARELHMGETSLKRHLERGDLRTLSRASRGVSRQWQLIDVESVRQLQAKRESLLTLAQAANFFGTSEDQIVALVAAGLMRAEHGPPLDKTPIWSFTKEALQQFIERLLDGLPVKPTTPSGIELLSLSQVLRIFSAVGERLPDLLQAIQQGSFSAFRDQEATGLQGLWFNRSDVTAHLEQIQQARERSLYTVEEACVHLHCKPPALHRWHRTELLVPCKVENSPSGTHMWYAIQDVLTFRERYITTDRAAELLGCADLTVQRWAKAGRIAAVSGPDIDGSHTYRFDREVLVQWRYERLTVGEAASLLGVSVSTIDRWAREDKLEPLADMGGKQRWFAREALMRCRSLRPAQAVPTRKQE